MHHETAFCLVVVVALAGTTPALADISSFPLPDSSNPVVGVVSPLAIAFSGFHAGAWLLSFLVKLRASRTNLFVKTVIGCLVWAGMMAVDAPLARAEREQRRGQWRPRQTPVATSAVKPVTASVARPAIGSATARVAPPATATVTASVAGTAIASVAVPAAKPLAKPATASAASPTARTVAVPFTAPDAEPVVGLSPGDAKAP